MPNLHKNFKITNLVARCAITVAAATFLTNSPISIAEGKKSDWPLYSYDYANTNNNPAEKVISAFSAPGLVKAWETFNDDSVFSASPPTGFIFETALGLSFPSPVVGVVSPPLIQDGTLYYIDSLGTVFARDAKTGKITNPERHWTVHLVDPDFESNEPVPKLVPDLYYTAPMLTDEYLWVVSSVHGRLHAVKRSGGDGEIDFDPTTPAIDPYKLANAPLLASSLGESVIINDRILDYKGIEKKRTLLIRGMDVIVNDAVANSGAVGMILALDISDAAHPKEIWRTPTVETNSATNKPFGSGVSAGSGLAVDIKRGLLFGGTGQWTSPPYAGYPALPAPTGFVDRSDALWAIDYHTGKFVWFNQFHNGDVFNLGAPEPAGPNSPVYRDADVLSPSVLFSAKMANGRARDLVGNGSKGGLYRVVDRETGATVWQREISKRTGLGGIQAGAAVADGRIYVAGFEGIDDGFSDANFDALGSRYLNAFFATFSPAFWADVEDVTQDNNPATGVQVKLYSLDAATGKSNWQFGNGKDYVELLAGAALRHVSTANGLVYVTTTAGKLFILAAQNGQVLFTDQTRDLNAVFNLGLGKTHHAPMNAGTVISDGMVYVPSGGQNNPSGGITVYKPSTKH
jgi:outer membrane protein assembly factor BamB